MKKYSQYAEQQYILAAFGDRGGRFLDIGAYNPFEFSNTRALYEMGWSGVMIEPSPGPMCSLISEYGNDARVTLIQAVVGVVHCPWAGLHVTDDCVSTTQESEFEKWRVRARFNGSILVPVISLELIGEEFPGFDFVNFDAEGSSVDLFFHSLKLGWRPRCVCVENDGRAVELASRAACDQYFVTYTNGTNTVLVRAQ